MTQQVNIQANNGYTIQRGDTLEGIAQRAYNNGSQPYQMAIYLMNQRAIGGDSSVLPLGATIWIPSIGHPPQIDIVYIVQPGDTLSSIAQQTYSSGLELYRTAMCRINNLATCVDPNAIHAGDPLYLPPISNPTPRQNTFYIVQDGDTLSSIAQHAYHNRKKTKLISQCVYNEKGRIKPGELLCIPSDPASKQLPPGGGNIHGPDTLPH